MRRNEGQYRGQDQIAGTPTETPLPANRPVGGLPPVKASGKGRPRRVRRGG